MKYHVATNIGHIIGEAETQEEAIAVCRRDGFAPTEHVDFLSPDLAADELRYEPDGRGAFIVLCDDTGRELSRDPNPMKVPPY